jgi:hypothetical protein
MEIRCPRFPINNGWLLIFFTVSLIILTCLQARGSVLTKRIDAVNQSRSYPLLILRTISELAGLSLSAAVSSALERVKWALVCRKDNHSPTSFLDFLALDEGTKIWSLLSLTAGAAGPSVGTRLLSASRLLFMFIVPVIGILIMSESAVLSFLRKPPLMRRVRMC